MAVAIVSSGRWWHLVVGGNGSWLWWLVLIVMVDGGEKWLGSGD